MKIMEDSHLSYIIGVPIDSLGMKIEYDTYAHAIMSPGTYLEYTSSGPVMRSYLDAMSSNQDLAELFNQAEKAFQRRDMEATRASYEAIIDIQPDNAMIMTYIGQTYAIQKDIEKTREWYLKAIEANPAEFTAHWFLANIYADIDKQYDKAIEHITIAHLLNRNNPRLLKDLIGIYKLNETPYEEWNFRPAYALKKDEGTKRLIGVDTSSQGYPMWLTYAIGKALWQFEPGYPDSVMAGSKQPAFIAEEIECLLNTALVARGYYKDTEIPLVEFKKLVQAVERPRDLESFALYEVVLRRMPQTGILLTDEVKKQLVRYIAEYHTVQE